ncbi:hypothetical protein V500_03502 [Pseudogymnoascus sp. VKM F-4518 (FW-2643)]|nr:hypothetical protein V500_03502 [Pseudogymnoascus sp. VKM F-4518 (FW-2643)]
MPPSSPASRTPVYFLSIGGPNTMDATEHPAYAKLSAVGHEITTLVKPKAIVVISGHWQDDSLNDKSRAKINVAEEADLIYDFYGLPRRYYEYEFPNRGSPEVAERVAGLLREGGVEVEGVERGLDHGIWAGFIVAFDPKKNPLNVPIVQVSLLNTDDPEQHYRMGQALESLRDEGVLIIATGMAVHNLGDFWVGRGSGGGRTMPYARTFDVALKEAATASSSERQAKMAALLKRGDARQAHPSLDHILPIYIAAGAAGADVGEQLWTLPEGSMSWAQYRFGGVGAA